MTAHKHVDMITAKANNMDLVALRKTNDGMWREVLYQSEIKFKSSYEYFLCLPKHKEACLHRLNGGEVQIKYNSSNNWCDCTAAPDKPTWGHDHIFMDEFVITRIKPKKEKRWIIAKPHSLASMMYFETEKQARDAIDRINKFEGSDRHGGQAIEIEIEV